MDPSWVISIYTVVVSRKSPNKYEQIKTVRLNFFMLMFKVFQLEGSTLIVVLWSLFVAPIENMDTNSSINATVDGYSNVPNNILLEMGIYSNLISRKDKIEEIKREIKREYIQPSRQKFPKVLSSLVYFVYFWQGLGLLMFRIVLDYTLGS